MRERVKRTKKSRDVYLFKFQVLFEKGKLTQKTHLLLSSNLSSVLKEALSPRTEFWESGKTLRVLSEESYFRENGEGDVEWPPAIKKMISESKC